MRNWLLSGWTSFLADIGANPASVSPTIKMSGARLLAMEAEDHYVRIHTDRGASLVLTAFETALAKAAHLDGMRIHRSWWVARAAVVGIQRGDGRATLALSGGIQAPVSRRYARLLRAAGWY
jgi:DNA-binding LytR/AlgR family response regulator